MRKRREGADLGRARAEPKAGVRRSRKEAMLELVGRPCYLGKTTVDAPQSEELIEAA